MASRTFSLEEKKEMDQAFATYLYENDVTHFEYIPGGHFTLVEWLFVITMYTIPWYIALCIPVCNTAFNWAFANPAIGIPHWLPMSIATLVFFIMAVIDAGVEVFEHGNRPFDEKNWLRSMTFNWFKTKNSHALSEMLSEGTSWWRIQEGINRQLALQKQKPKKARNLSSQFNKAHAFLKKQSPKLLKESIRKEVEDEVRKEIEAELKAAGIKEV